MPVLDRAMRIAAGIPGFAQVFARNMGVSAVFHQVIDERRPHEGTAFCNELRPDFHEIVEFLTRLRSPKGEVWITFDDGYAAAAEALNKLAPKHPNVNFVYFVCPEKTSARVGYRWDAWERQHDSSTGPADFESFMRSSPSLEENMRADLLATAADDRFRLASVDQCLELQQHSNVHLGNHTNRHFELTTMSFDEAVSEVRASTEKFVSLFGKAEHFAFPYGSPNISYNEEHVKVVRSLGYRYIWSTEPLGFKRASAENIVIPRIPISGLRTATETKANITKYLVRTRIQQLRRSR